MSHDTKTPLLNNSSKHQSLDRFTLIYALKKGYFNLAQHLLNLGVDPNLADDSDSFKRTPLIYCTFIREERWALTIAQNLLEHNADLRRGDSRHLTPLHYCCAFGLDALLKLFLNSLDFDLSKSLDVNGNNCMHYAVRSRNLNCIRLIVSKCKQKRILSINITNKYGLRPSDLEDEDKLGRVKQIGIYPGKDSLESCKTAVVKFMETFEYNDGDNLNNKEPVEDKEHQAILNKAKSQELWKKAVAKLNKAYIQDYSKLDTSVQNEGQTNDFFLKTEFGQKLNNNSGNKTPDKGLKKKGKETNSTNSRLSMSPNLAGSNSSYPQESIIEEQTARVLTQKSFFIKFKDREKEFIDLNELFMGKESLFEGVKIKWPSIDVPNPKSKIKLVRPKTPAKSETKSFLDMDALDLINDLNDASSEKLIEKSFINLNPEDSWRKEMPTVFARLENKLTASYRGAAQLIIPNKPKSAKGDAKNSKGRGSKLDLKRAISMSNVNISNNEIFNN